MATDGFGNATRILWRCAFPMMRTLFRRNMGIDPARMSRARQRLAGYFDRLELEIRPGGYLVGDSFTVADLTACAIMTAIIRPPEFPYALPDPWPEELTELRCSMAERSGFRWVLDIYTRPRGTSCEIG
jgi:glutathione S-transferase